MPDPNEPPREQPAPDRAPEVVDAEVVDSGSSAQPRPDPSDPQYQEYQQFLEFQRFREWQRQYGDTGQVPPWQQPGTSTRPWWKRLLRLLRFTLVRRLLYLVALLLLLNAGINYYFGSDTEDAGGGLGTGGSNPPHSNPIASTDPKRAISGLYNYIAYLPERACAMFTVSGQAAFAKHTGAPDCVSAARKWHAQVTVPTTFANPGFANNSVQTARGQALVDSCTLQVAGGPRLGKFLLTRDSTGGWLIDRYEKTPAQCG